MRIASLPIAFVSVVMATAARAEGCPPPQGEVLTVARVDAQASLVLEDGRRVRLAGAEAAGTTGDFRQAVAALAEGQAVRLAPSGVTRDRWERTVAHVWRADGLWIEAELIGRGLALRAPGLPVEACARALERHEPAAAAAQDVSIGRLGAAVVVSGTVSALRKSRGRVYMKLEHGAGRLMVTARETDVPAFAVPEDEWIGSVLTVRGHLEWWDEPTIAVAAPWDAARGTATRAP